MITNSNFEGPGFVVWYVKGTNALEVEKKNFIRDTPPSHPYEAQDLHVAPLEEQAHQKSRPIVA